MSKPQSLLSLVDTVLKNKWARSWAHEDGLSIYLRQGYHILDQPTQASYCLDIANVEAETPGQGAFTMFLNKAEKVVQSCPTCDYIFIESIMNPRLVEFLQRRGYQFTLMSNELAPHMFKKFSIQ